MKGKIAEIFDSLQGEGIYLGEKQLFVRFFGCNLHCSFCDTQISNFKEYEPAELFEEIKAYQDVYHSISFTGGEPLLQKDFVKEVALRTALQGYRNYLETNGTLFDELSEVIDYFDIVAMDIKLPSSTGSGSGLWDKHRKFLEIASRKEVFLKSVICSTTTEEDLYEALNLTKDINLGTVLVLQPNSYENHDNLDGKLKKFKNICRREGVAACVIPQVQKVIGIK